MFSECFLFRKWNQVKCFVTCIQNISLQLPALFAALVTITRLLSSSLRSTRCLSYLLLVFRRFCYFSVSCSMSSNQIVLAAFRNQTRTNLPEGQSFRGVFCTVISNFIKMKFSRHLFRLPLSILCGSLTFWICFFLPSSGNYNGFN